MPISLEDVLSDSYPGLVLLDGFDAAFEGVVQDSDELPHACYCSDKVVEILSERDGISELEAWDFFDFHIAGSALGPMTPVFLERFYV